MCQIGTTGADIGLCVETRSVTLESASTAIEVSEATPSAEISSIVLSPTSPQSIAIAGETVVSVSISETTLSAENSSKVSFSISSQFIAIAGKTSVSTTTLETTSSSTRSQSRAIANETAVSITTSEKTSSAGISSKVSSSTNSKLIAISGDTPVSITTSKKTSSAISSNVLSSTTSSQSSAVAYETVASITTLKPTLSVNTSSKFLTSTNSQLIAIGDAAVPITTTITSPPAFFSTSLAFNTEWTSDTVTMIHGTQCPVLYDCEKVCGGVHHGLIIWGLGGRPVDPVRPGCPASSPRKRGLLGPLFRSTFGCGTEFDLPPIPKPFVIDNIGEPEEVDPDNDDGDENDKTTMTNTSPTSTTQVSSSTSKATSSAASTQYVIFPTSGATKAQISNITDTLNVGSEYVLQIELGSAVDEVMFVGVIDESFASLIAKNLPVLINPIP